MLAHIHTHIHRRRLSSSSTSSASSSDDRDDVITTLNTSGHVSPAHSPTPILVNLSDTPPTPVGRGSSAVARGNSVSSHSNNGITDLMSSNTDNGLSQYSLIDPSQLPFSLPTFTTNGLPGNSGFQEVLTAPQSSTSLLVSASQPLSSISIPTSSRSSGQPMPVITSHVLPMPPYPQFNLSSTSELNSDFSFLFNDNVSYAIESSNTNGFDTETSSWQRSMYSKKILHI